MTSDQHNHDELDAFFDAARRHPPQPSAEMLARVLADAQAEHRPVAVLVRRVRRSPWQQFLHVVGGWPAMGALVATTVAGLWIGINPPASFESFGESVFGVDAQASFWVDTSAELALGLSAEEF